MSEGPTIDDGLDEVIQTLQRMVLRHPIASQALFSMFVEQGRQYAETRDGKRMLESLANSEMVHRTRAVWEAATLGTLSVDLDDPLPDSLLDTLAHVVAQDGLEPRLAEWFRRRQTGGS